MGVITKFVSPLSEWLGISVARLLQRLVFAAVTLLPLGAVVVKVDLDVVEFIQLEHRGVLLDEGDDEAPAGGGDAALLELVDLAHGGGLAGSNWPTFRLRIKLVPP